MQLGLTVAGRAFRRSDDCSYHSTLVLKYGIVSLEFGVWGMARVNVGSSSGQLLAGFGITSGHHHTIHHFQHDVIFKFSIDPEKGVEVSELYAVTIRFVHRKQSKARMTSVESRRSTWLLNTNKSFGCILSEN